MWKNKLIIAGALITLLAPLLPLQGIQSRSLVLNRFEHFSKGEFENVELTRLGELKRSITMEPYASVEAMDTVWKALWWQGELYVAGGDRGAIYRINEEGEAIRFFSPGEILPLAMEVGPDDALYVATSPAGALLRFETPDSAPEIYFDPEEQYIWDVKFDEEGNLFVATGGSAKLYRLPVGYKYGDEPELWFKTTGTSLNSMSITPEGDILVSAYPEAYIYKVTGQEEGDVIAQANAEEVTALSMLDDGSLLYTVFGAKGQTQNAPANNTANKNAAKPTGTSKSKQAVEGPVYRVRPDGYVQPILNFPVKSIYSFLQLDKNNWLLGVSAEPYLVKYQLNGEWSMAQELPEGKEISALTKDEDGEIYVISSHPVKIYKLGEQAERGTYESDIIDAKQVATWGAIRPFTGTLYVSESTTWYTRSGNSAKPDDTWSDWAKAEVMKVQSPPARYLQYRANFGENSYPVRSVEIFYRYANQAPIIEHINIIPVGVNVRTIKANAPVINVQQLLKSQDPQLKIAEPKTHQQVFVTSRKGHITIGWQAKDPNGDQMTFKLEMGVIYEDGVDEWVIVANEITETVYSLPVEGMQEGYYHFRVTASDAKSNPKGEGMTSMRQSEPHLVDYTAPELSYEYGEEGPSEFIVHLFDMYSVVKKLEYSLNGKDFLAVIPDDNLYDQQEEKVTLLFEGLENGKHSLVLRASDTSGNIGTLPVTFEIQ